MAEWGKYLKEAVANVEQQLDKVLLENQASDSTSKQTQSQSKRVTSSKSRRPDLSERLRQAASGKLTSSETNETKQQSPEASVSVEQDGAVNEQNDQEHPSHHLKDIEPNESGNIIEELEEKSEPELITTSNFFSAPDFGKVLSDARKLALAEKRDDLLNLVEELEKTDTEFNAYVDSVSERLKSMNSKLSVITSDKIARSSGSEQKIALLMDEGNRLSKRELDLNLTIKKLRAERTAALSVGAQSSSKDAEIENLKKIVADQEGKLIEKDGLIEHYRSIAEVKGENFLKNDNSYDSTKSNQSADESKIEILQNHHAQDREKWHKVEAELLIRIAELEQTHEAHGNTVQQLQRRLSEAQKLAGSSRDVITSLQDEIDNIKEAATSVETRLKAQVNDLTTEVIILTHKNEQQQQELLKTKEKEIQNAPESFNTHDISPDNSFLGSPVLNDVPPRIRISPQSTTSHKRSASHDSHREYPLRGLGGSDASLSHLDQVAVGPSGPFGGLSDDYNTDYHHDSRDHDKSALETQDGFASPSRREGSMLGSESLPGSHIHLVRKMTLAMQKLENELSSAQKIAELCRKQRDEAQSEVAHYIDLSEQFQNLQETHSNLQNLYENLKKDVNQYKRAIAERDERIEELDADVRDLKDMYKEQIEALITEIESLKR